MRKPSIHQSQASIHQRATRLASADIPKENRSRGERDDIHATAPAAAARPFPASWEFLEYEQGGGI
jgi:hypothetical protein